jgi:hypothetical protein
MLFCPGCLGGGTKTWVDAGSTFETFRLAGDRRRGCSWRQRYAAALWLILMAESLYSL